MRTNVPLGPIVPPNIKSSSSSSSPSSVIPVGLLDSVPPRRKKRPDAKLRPAVLALLLLGVFPPLIAARRRGLLVLRFILNSE